MSNKYTILPGSGAANTIDPSQWPNLLNALPGPSGSISAGGWTEGNEGFVQQTFLGASIRSFNINAGFGDSSSQLSLSVVNDEFNKSDGFGLGGGDDPYHNGEYDEFKPPVVGAPVFFKFGKNYATIEQAWRQTFDDLYGFNTIGEWSFPTSDWEEDPDKMLLKQDLPPYHYADVKEKKIIDKSALWNIGTQWRGKYHFAFGGILQSYTQNRGQGGNPLYNVNITDPREILSNAQMLFNNYQGTTFNNKNLFNIYGFLEYDPSDELQKALDNKSKDKFSLKKIVSRAGAVSYVGVGRKGEAGPRDTYLFAEDVGALDPNREPLPKPFPTAFPITGQGYSRRSEKGIPFYRVRDAINAIFEYNGFLPPEYKRAGFGGQIDFRGYNYVVDFSGLPTHLIPEMYYMDFDQMDMLSFAQEICDITSHELYVQLLPVINHPACSFLYSLNQHYANLGQYSNMVHGIIRLDAINKTVQPRYGAIKEYLDRLALQGIYTTNQDVGYEVSNVTTDKFVVGAQETEMYFFDTTHDRDTLHIKRADFTTLSNTANLNVRILEQDKWQLETMEKQQILPYYGLLGKNAVSIPRGWGAYQQILLDARGLDAYGVGNYYVATEIELRAALVSFERWKEFLLSYNDTYIQDISEHQAFISALASQEGEDADQFTKVLDDFEDRLGIADSEDPVDQELKEKYIGSMRNREFAVTVPRCMWDSDRPWMGDDGYPASPCSPPYGYPLYYQRATKIGIPEAGVAEILADKTAVISNLAKLQNAASNEGPMVQVNSKRGLETLRDKYDKRIAEIKLQWIASNVNDPEGYINDPEFIELTEKLDQATKALTNFESKSAASSHRKQLIAQTTQYLKDNEKFLYNLQKTAKFHLANAKKVYDFVQKVANENLGTKFLVKIPKACNLRFQPNIVTYRGDETEAGNKGAGPFGFTPRPINSDAGYTKNDSFKSLIFNKASDVSPNDLYNHYNNSFIGKTAVEPQDGRVTAEWKQGRLTQTNKVEKPYTYGALKNNYNPLSEKWEHNYVPDNQGGWFPFSIFNKTISKEEYRKYLKGDLNYLPLAQRQGLVPIDMTNLVTNSNRVKPYVIYHDSQFNDMSSLSQKDFTQQENQWGTFFPDVAGTLDNLNNDKELAFDKIQERLNSNNGERGREEVVDKQTLAYVSVTVDDKLYMPPRLEQKEVDIWAREYELAFTEPLIDIVRKTDPSGCTSYELDYKRAVPIFTVPAVNKNERDPRIPFEDAGGRDGTKAQHVDFKRDYDKILNGYIIDTQLENLDNENVYALITVPGRIKPTVDRRWVDGPLQQFNTVKMKNLMMADVVKNDPHFAKPSIPTPSAIKFICSEPEQFPTQLEAEARAKELGITGTHVVTTWTTAIFGWTLPISGIAYVPGSSPEIYQQFNLQNLSSAEEISKKVKQGVAFNDPLGKLAFISPSPVYPDMAVLPLMSMERCYGPWVSSSVLDPAFPVKYSNIGGKVEFVKDENLAPWNFFGYQLMNEAGALQANFSNSLLLFSERGGFVYPAAPTGVNLARALQQSGPLVTSISVDVGNQGVKTTVKLDLYTSQFGKLAKQKEMAISQIARERQKLSDERNAAIRRGLGKSQTASNLMDSIAGPASELAALNREQQEVFTEQEQGKQKDYLISLGVDGGTLTTSDDIKAAMENMEDKKVREQASNAAVVDFGEMFVGFARGMHDTLPSEDYINPAAIEEALNRGAQ